MSSETPTTQAAPLAVAAPVKSPITFGDAGIKLATMEEAYRFAQYVVKSGFAPKGMDQPESVLIALQMGAEVGLAPMQSLQSIAVINGRPGVFGDAALALVRASGLLERYEQKSTAEGATVTVKRKGEAEMTTTFTKEDAQKAGLLGKTGPWSQYPARMMLFRARSFALRDAFGDVLKGLRTTEELQDIPAGEINVTPRSGIDALTPDGKEVAQ